MKTKASRKPLIIHATQTTIKNTKQITSKIHEKCQETTLNPSQTEPKTTPKQKTKPKKQTISKLTHTKKISQN